MFAGRVDAALREVFPSLEGHALYCCGSASMVQTVLHEALRLRLARMDFHADAFVPSHGASL
jgi:CDP-4-dehydro-6-deoxyglucose reductase/terephthalate 1,2-dioxygenase reductase component